MTHGELIKRIKKLEAQESRSKLLRASEPPAKDAELVACKVRDPLTWLQHHTQTKDPHWREAARVPRKVIVSADVVVRTFRGEQKGRSQQPMARPVMREKLLQPSRGRFRKFDRF